MTPFVSNSHSRVPPGFRFHPTDEELVGYYLQKKVASKKIDLDVIHEIDLYKLEPWDLHERCKIGSAEQTEWYFFSHKDKKYPTGTRTNRATAAGFWKATGRDKAIHAKYKLIGMRKTLVFYKGRAPNGQKTDWIMHEYRLEDENNNNNNDDGWVVCRVFKKRNSHKLLERDLSCCYDEQLAFLPELESPSKFGGDLPYHHSLVNCKQEFEPEHYGPPHDPFSQLPQLESPRLTSHMPSSTTLKGFFSHNIMRDHQPPHFTLEPSHFDAVERPVYHQQQPVTDWRMVDRIAAAQLSNEGDTTKERYSTTDESDPAEDVALLLRLSKQHAQDYNHAPCEADLWSFGRCSTRNRQGSSSSSSSSSLASGLRYKH